MSDLDIASLTLCDEAQRWLDERRLCDAPADALAELDAGVRLARQLATQAKAFKDLQDQLRTHISVLMTVQGLQTFTNDFGTASFHAGYPKISYDAKALDILCRDDPALKERLAPYRSATNVPGYLDIR